MKVVTEKRRLPITDHQISLEEYLAYDDGTDIVYELVKGELVAMSVGTGRHGAIAEFVNAEFKDEIKRSSLAWTSKDMKIGVQSPRGNRWDTCRIPDVAVILMEQWEEMQDREAVIYLNSPQPLLVVEVVSPSTIQEDYRAKHSEYSVLEIPEYWIVDIAKQVVTICQLVDGRYDDREFEANQSIVSLTLPNLTLTASQILNAKR